jgi:hypothetical protein
VQGGTVSKIQLIRGATTIDTGMTQGQVYLSKGDIAKITYTVKPAVTFAAVGS